MDDDKLKVEQRDNIVYGDQAAGNIYKYVYNSQKTPMTHLIESFKDEQKSNVRFSDTIDELQHFNEVINHNDVQGLESKLANANRQDEIAMAIRAKDRFVKKLLKYELFESAQMINAFLLGEALTRFRKLVVPLILEGKDRKEIDAAIFAQIINPIHSLLEENVLRFTTDEIEGMIYFLAGNCHIRWDKC